VITSKLDIEDRKLAVVEVQPQPFTWLPSLHMAR